MSKLPAAEYPDSDRSYIRNYLLINSVVMREAVSDFSDLASTGGKCNQVELELVVLPSWRSLLANTEIICNLSVSLFSSLSFEQSCWSNTTAVAAAAAGKGNNRKLVQYPCFSSEYTKIIEFYFINWTGVNTRPKYRVFWRAQFSHSLSPRNGWLKFSWIPVSLKFNLHKIRNNG